MSSDEVRRRRFYDVYKFFDVNKREGEEGPKEQNYFDGAMEGASTEEEASTEENVGPSGNATILDEVDWYKSEFQETLRLGNKIAQNKNKLHYRVYKLKEVAQGTPSDNRANMENVIASMGHSRSPIIYFVVGYPDHVSFYVGVASRKKNKAEEGLEQLRSTMEGNLLGSVLETDHKQGEVENHFMTMDSIGVLTGVPTIDEDNKNASETEFQGVERLANSMMGENWILSIVAHPSSKQELKERTRAIYDLITEISSQLKVSYQQSSTLSKQTTDTKGSSKDEQESKSDSKSKASSETGQKTEQSGKDSSKTRTTSHTSTETNTKSKSESTGTNKSRSESETKSTGESETREYTDRRMEEWYEHLSEHLLERFRAGFSKGMFKTTIYFASKGDAAFDRLTANLVSLFQGNQKTMTPLRPYSLKRSMFSSLGDLFRRPYFSSKDEIKERMLIAHSIPVLHDENIAVSTWLNSEELSLLTSPSSSELPGLQVRPTVDFGLNYTNLNEEQAGIHLGHLIQHGRLLETPVKISPRTLNSHTFVAGVTGAGKTTTCMKLLKESGLNFMVIEPAKTEYRALLRHQENGEDLEFYTLNREDLSAFRINPFELVSLDEPLVSHIDILKATLLAVFPMEAAMPYLVEEAIVKAYEVKGWDIHSTTNMHWDNPWSPEADVWPNFSDMINELDGVIRSKGLGKEFEEKYHGSLVARLTNLTLGTKGRMLNARRSIDFDRMLDSKVIIELDEIKDEEDKALIMGLILTRVAECAKHRFRRDPGFQYLMLVEEAHRLLSKSEPGDPGSKKMGVSMFSNMLAEVRKYGMGLVIADQIPSKLVPDVIKNTNTKIIHRLFAADDRSMIGDAMCLSDDQRDFLPRLKPGETIVYQGGWHAPVWLKVPAEFDTSLEDVSFEQIRQCGQSQLWKDRHRLLPNFSTSYSLDEENFFHAYKQGLKILASLERFLPVIMNDKEKQKESTEIALSTTRSNLLRFGDFLDGEEEISIVLSRIIIDTKNVDTVFFEGLEKIVGVIVDGNTAKEVRRSICQEPSSNLAAVSIFP